MEPRSSAQDVHRCDLCETAIVHSYCDFCHVNLCKPCIGEHITDGYDQHKIVPFQQRRSTFINPKCETHPFKHCKFKCKNCENILVCSTCMASEQNGGHRFEELLDIYKTKKETIKNDAKELENCFFPSYEEIALNMDNQLSNVDGGYEKITTEISKQGEQWHREIDVIINRMKTEINEIKKKHRDVLQKHLDEIRQTQSPIKQTLQALRDIQESTEVFRTIEYISKVKDFSKRPHMVQVSLPTLDHEKLYSFFRHFTSFSTDTKENTSSLNLQNTSVRELLDEPELVRTITTGQHQYLRSVTCLEDDMIWVGDGTDNIHCFTINGTILQKIKTKSGKRTRDIAVDSSGNLLFADESKKVYQVKNGHTEELITFPGWVPCQMCVTSTDDLLVTMHNDDYTQSKVVRYSRSREKQIIQFDGEGKPLYSENGYIKYITENKNRDICVADYGAGAVVVVNQDGKLKWRYTGHPSVTKNKPFKPPGITTDSQSRVLTAGTDNHCIHILDQNGQFLRYIDNCDLEYPWGLCVDNDDTLFVCEFNSKGNIKKIKYLK
ncbi:tripartite motif-containing protein 2-like [Magallana gigas]|uniref:tripartite motif-containing protein 2-like n=1 Tax=Magallana gigas TaxID=29159 RepID=UPI003341762B